jgi:serine phosphatase RsbU (regulator of sigma subunit)
MLPLAAKVFAGERRFQLSAYMEPAREVGGDLYDFFMLDRSRVFLMVGDVSGKGLPASIFMALSKSSCKNNVVRQLGDVGAALSAANVEIARDNPEQLFVTVLACVLDADTGTLAWCNAGHEPMYALAARDSARRLDGKGGPPLCMLDDFSYAADSYTMSPGETLVLISDGVTEATSPSGELYGRARLEALLSSLSPAADPDACATAIRDAVRDHTAGAEVADDVTILTLRWKSI